MPTFSGPIALIAACIGFVLLACGGQEATSTTPGDTPSTQPQVSSTIAPKGQIPRGGTLRRLWRDPPTLDPHLVSDSTSAAVVVEIFGGLVALDTDLALVTDLADRWEVSPDGRIYTFHLREKARFHDSKPVTAEDVKWSLERAAHPDTGSTVADLYLGDIVGVKEKLEGQTDEVRGVQIIDNDTIQITVDAPKPYFLAKLTQSAAYVLDRESVEKGGDTWTDHPNGTGYFKLMEYAVGKRITLERNESHHLGPPFLDRVEMNLAGGDTLALYENNEIDVASVRRVHLERLLDPNEPLNSELVAAPGLFKVSYIGFHTQKPPFDDVKFRRALNHAIDKELIAQQVLSGLQVPAYGILPPGLPGHNTELKGLEYDREKARRLLADSRYADPASRPSILMTAPGTSGSVGRDVEAVVKMWREVLDVEVELQQTQLSTFLQDLYRGRLQAYAGLSWNADYPDPQNFLEIHFHSRSSNNHGAYSNPLVDGFLDRAGVEQDIGERIKLYQRAEQVIVDDAAWVPMWFSGLRYALVKPYVKGYKLTPIAVPMLKEVYIEKG